MKLSASLLLLLLCSAGPLRADTEELSAKLACEPAAGVGRVRCSLSVSAPPGTRLSWVDALVVETPAFARTLRTRIAHQGSGDESAAELLLALVADREGRGRLSVRARAVACPKAGQPGRCHALTRLESLELHVGAPQS
ncbi:MAG: hypothetical protein QM756_15790 [Polyangiaceae bacterium]